MLVCRCCFLVNRMHCVLAQLSLILQRFDQFSILVMHDCSFLAVRWVFFGAGPVTEIIGKLGYFGYGGWGVVCV